MQQFHKMNNLIGWGVFFGTFLIYWLTMEHTASFWDCGEFIASASQLEVPHPPGAPLFLLIGRLFSLLALGDTSQIAYWVNMVSVVCSALTVLFLFWTITLLALKTGIVSEEKPTNGQLGLCMGAGITGALSFAFSDSFWFSALEAEVYAMSSLFTAVVFWAMLRWDRIENHREENRWLLLIAYLVGLSIGVHILNLVTIPVLGLLYYFKRYEKATFMGGVLALMTGIGILGVILWGIISGLPRLAFALELTLVNQWKLPFSTGIIIFSTLLISVLIYTMVYSIRHQKIVLNTLLLSFTFILIGYTSYGVILIRANYNPPVNLNNPGEINRFISYLNREQYGQRPLLQGPLYTAEYMHETKGKPIYQKGKIQYETIDYNRDIVWDKTIFFPRIYSRAENHPAYYRQILALAEGQEPTMYDNLRFFWKHQLGQMYMRYFLWNFVGRQSDVQDAGVCYPFFSSGKAPSRFQSNKAHNQFYGLPLFLGILGFLYLFRKNRKLFWIISILFLMTGVALVVYLNAPPIEPRERDYVYVGSFYTFCISIGFGVLGGVAFLQRFLSHLKILQRLTIVASASVPLLLLIEGWDDHNRANRYYSVDSAWNLLQSCAPDSILFVTGDNETYPLWYLQEVEKVRRDVRVCNLTLLTADWYVEQMQRATYTSKALPLSLKKEQYQRGTNDQIPLVEAYRNPNFSEQEAQSLNKNGMHLPAYLKLLAGNTTKLTLDFGAWRLNTFPTQKMVLPLDKEKIKAINDFIEEDKKASLPAYMQWHYPKKNIFKSDLAVLDIIVNNEWERPIYFSDGLGGKDNYLGLMNHLQLEGFAYRLMPFRVAVDEHRGGVNSDKMYKNMLQKFRWRELTNPAVYYDENYRRLVESARQKFVRLCKQLIQEGKLEKARKVLNFCLDNISDKAIPYSYFSPPLVHLLWIMGEKDEALKVGVSMADNAHRMLLYLAENTSKNQAQVANTLGILNQLASIFKALHLPEAKKYTALTEQHYQVFYP